MAGNRLTDLEKQQRGPTMEQSSARAGSRPVKETECVGAFVLATGGLVLCFSVPLFQVVRFALASELYSYILLVPFVSVYLAWLKRKSVPPQSDCARGIALLPLVAGFGMLIGYWFIARTDPRLAEEDRLALIVSSFLLFFFGVCCLCFGKGTLRTMAFPLGFLVLMVPLPALLRDWIEVFLQHGSADAAHLLFILSGTPVFRQDLAFQLPGFSMQVAAECSGIRSSLVLLITSLVAGHLFLRTPWKRSVLALIVIPLAILRNGLRIFIIGQLCVHYGPEMIRSPIHRHGGPLFFLVSLVPFFLILFILWKSDRVRANLKPEQSNSP